MTKQDRFRFRVWDKQKCKYVEDQYGELYFAIDIEGNLIAYADNYSDRLNCDNGDFGDDFIKEQCTGLKDESEDLIYENDIVELDDGTELVNAVIEWDNNAGCWNIRTSDTIYTFDNLYGNEMRVIGNIHENPDLLENE